MAKKKKFIPPECLCGKHRYRNRDQAVTSILRRIKNGAPALMVYRCPSGYGFHMSSNVGNVQGRKVN